MTPESAIELAKELDHLSDLGEFKHYQAAAMLRKQDAAIKQLREALGDISYAVEWGGDVKEAQEKADAATEEFHG
jgi:hypothetical protein